MHEMHQGGAGWTMFILHIGLCVGNAVIALEGLLYRLSQYFIWCAVPEKVIIRSEKAAKYYDFEQQVI